MLLLLAGKRQWRMTAAAVASAAVVLGGGYAAARLASEASPVAEWRAAFADPFSDYSMTKRFEIWGRTLDRSAEEPFGTGMGTVGRARRKAAARRNPPTTAIWEDHPARIARWARSCSSVESAGCSWPRRSGWHASGR